ncbi:MAG: hypothetical protein WCS51_04005 [Bacilli bacterium]
MKNKHSKKKFSPVEKAGYYDGFVSGVGIDDLSKKRNDKYKKSYWVGKELGRKKHYPYMNPEEQRLYRINQKYKKK